jgi:hypothetical protein
MSRQINLYHERFRKKREWLTLANVATAGGVLALALAVAGAWAWREAAVRGAEAAAAEARLKTVKEQFDAQSQAAASRKPNVQLAAEMANAEIVLQRREQIARLLEGGAIGNTGGFSDYLRGLARQAPAGLWLTGFTIGSGGNDMEIRGRMLDGALLPDYIHRLGSEKAFQGRSFAALTLNRPDARTTPAAAAPAAAVPPAPTLSPRHVDFVLTPRMDAPGGKP